MTDKEKLKLLIEAIDYSFWNPIEKDYNKELTYPIIDKVKYIKRVMEEEPVSSKPLVDIEIPFGARDSELIEESIAIPEGCYAVIEGNRVVIRKGEEPVSKDFEVALAQEWKGYNDRGSATVDALEDNTQELTFAKGFYRGWHYRKEEPASEGLEEAAMSYGRSIVQQACDKLSKEYGGVYTPGEDNILFVAKYFKAGAQWQKQKNAKDSALTWEDIREIAAITEDVQDDTSDEYLLSLDLPERMDYEQGEYEEILRRFNEYKKKERMAYERLSHHS